MLSSVKAPMHRIYLYKNLNDTGKRTPLPIKYSSAKIIMSTSIAAVAICKNEEEDLPGFLACLLPWVDEIVVVDDGSTDATLKLLAEAGPKVKVIHRQMERKGGFAAQRNAGIEAAESDWLLHMDIDERATLQFAEEIKRAIEDTSLNAFKYRRLNYFLNHPMRYGGWQHWIKPQLAKKGFHRFERAIHEECVVDGGEEQTGRLDLPMHHLIDRDYVERVGKNLHYMQLSGQEILDKGIQVKWYHLIGYPLYRGLKSYFVEGGWREGARGLVFALYTFGSTFNWYAFAWDKQNSPSRQALEEEITGQWNERTP